MVSWVGIEGISRSARVYQHVARARRRKPGKSAQLHFSDTWDSAGVAVASNQKKAARIVLIAAVCVVAASAAWADPNARGEDLYRLCSSCHRADASGNQDVGAPAIAGMAQWYVESQLEKFRNGQRGGHFDDVWGMRMRPMSLTLRSEGDVEAVSAYVAELPATNPPRALAGGDPVKGKALYTPCIACHAADGAGNQALFGPPLSDTSDWYLLRQLENFRSGARGSQPGDQTGAMMRPMAMTLADEQAMQDVIAHIMTLSTPK
jgi:cytochrome c oxidase subunit 2